MAYSDSKQPYHNERIVMNEGYQDCISSITKLGYPEFFNYKGSMVNKKN